MKIVTLRQPWASLIAINAKTIETRSWSTSHRGETGIHAAKGFSKTERAFFYAEPFYSAFKKAGYDSPDELPLGAIIAIVNIVDVVEMTEDNLPSEPERSFGFYEPGRFMWICQDVKPLEKPINTKGQLGLWNFELPTGEDV